MGTDIDKSAEHLAMATNLIEGVNRNDLRAATSRLHPSLIRVGLEASLRSMVGEFRNRFDVEVRAYGNDSATEQLWGTGLPEELRLAIYRVAEESPSNAMKHAMASRVGPDIGSPQRGQDHIDDSG